jgi:hypothetical protein
MSTRIAAADRWRRLLRLQRSSGLSISAFCRREGVSQPSFYSWRRKLQAEASFAEVKLKPEPQTRLSGIELRLPGRFRVVVRPGFDRRTLLELLHTLGDHSSARSAREADA